MVLREDPNQVNSFAYDLKAHSDEVEKIFQDCIQKDYFKGKIEDFFKDIYPKYQ